MNGNKAHSQVGNGLSIILPARNEADSLRELLPALTAEFPAAEVIVVDDGSEDGTGDLARELGTTVVTHPYRMGNGAAVKSGARAASGGTLVFLDADGQHDPRDIPALLERLEHGYSMAIGARRGAGSHANAGRLLANRGYNWLASRVVGRPVLDLTSGFRAVRAGRFREFLHLLPNGFSYPTTITMAFFRAGYPVEYVTVGVARREGKSHISPLKDGVRFLFIILRVATLYSPLKVFLPISVLHFVLGMLYYLYTYITDGRFTNMGLLLMSTAVIVFMIGLVSEQITALMYSRHDD